MSDWIKLKYKNGEIKSTDNRIKEDEEVIFYQIAMKEIESTLRDLSRNIRGDVELEGKIRGHI